MLASQTPRRTVRGLCFVGVGRRCTRAVTVWRYVALAAIYLRVDLCLVHGGRSDGPRFDPTIPSATLCRETRATTGVTLFFPSEAIVPAAVAP